VIDLKAIQDLDDDWASYSEAFIRRMAKSDKPFFLYHCTRGAHFDNYPSEKWRGKSPGRTSYTDTIVELDDILGRLVRALEETGQAENTLVFITSDNGPEQEIPPHGRTPFRGGKGDTFEGGMRVPGIVYWPGTVKGDRKSDGLFDLADLYNTSIALAGARDTMPKDRYIDGIDQSSFLLADNGQSNRRSIFYWFGGNYSGVRIDEFKSLTAASLRLGLDKGNIGGLSGVTSKMSAGWTFNLYTDPQEQDNITIRHIWCVPALIAEGDRYDQVLKKYPPGKLEIGF
jgi:arylsulfatase